MCFPFNIYNAYKTSVNPISGGLQHCSNCTESRNLPVALFLSSTYALLPDLCCMQKLKRIWAAEVPPNANTCSLGSSWHLSPTMLAASHEKWLKGEEEHLWPRHTSNGVQAREERRKPSHMGRTPLENYDGKKKNPHLLFSLKKVYVEQGPQHCPLAGNSLKQLPPTLLRPSVLLEPCWSEVTGRAGFTGLHLQLAITSTLL